MVKYLVAIVQAFGPAGLLGLALVAIGRWENWEAA